AVFSGSASVAGSTLTLSGLGPITVRASQAGNGNFNPATAVDQTFTVSKGTATITLANTSQAYTGTGRSVSVTTNPAGLAVTITYDGDTTAPVQVGTYTVNATVTDSLYDGSATGTLTINKIAQTISFGPLADVRAD